MRALFLQHDPGSQPGLVGAALVERGIVIANLPMAEDVTDGTWHGELPPASDFDLIVPLGAIWSLYDRDQVGSWIDDELRLLRDADEQGIPVLGICFGGQALAAAHGGEVVASSRPEIGWSTVDSIDPELVPPGPWMQWHSDRWVSPPGAAELAHNEVGPQAFVLRRNLAVQFHPEVDEATIASWIEMGGEASEAALAEAGTTAERVLADARSHRERAAADVRRLVDRFLGDVAQLV